MVLEMLLQLDLRPLVPNWINWTLLEKAHTCLYKISQVRVYVRVKTKPWRWNIVCRPARQDCVKTQIWGRIQEHFFSIESAQEYSSLHHSQMEDSLPRSDLPAKLNNREEQPWSDRLPRTQWSLWDTEFLYGDWENFTEGQPLVQHSTNQAFIVEWPDRNHFLKGALQPALSLPNNSWTTLRPW